MAAMWDEPNLDVSLSEYDDNIVTRLQAVCRSWLVRKALKGAQTEFQEIVGELDGSAVNVTWTESSLPVPVVHKASKKTRPDRNQEQAPGNVQNVENKSNNIILLIPLAEPEGKADKNNDQTALIKPVPDKTQSDQEVQTEFTLTDQPQHLCEARQDETNKHGPHKSSLTKDTVSFCKEPVHKTDDHPQAYFSPSQVCAETNSVHRRLEVVTDKSKGENYEQASSHRGDMNISAASHNDTTSSTTLSHSPHTGTASGGLAVVTGSAEIPGQLRRVDSFFGDQTSVWDSSSTGVQDHETVSKQARGQPAVRQVSRSAPHRGQLQTGADVEEVTLRSLSADELMKQRQNVAMELLWVQQAIISRKKYLRLKTQMEVAT